jgi:hypothetical protein
MPQVTPDNVQKATPLFDQNDTRLMAVTYAKEKLNETGRKPQRPKIEAPPSPAALRF